MATPNLNLQEIVLSDKLRTDFINKINNNMTILDQKYEELKDLFLEKTGQTTLQSAVAYIDKLVDANDATATPDKIFNGYVAYNGLDRMVGTGLSTPTSVQPHLLKNGVTAYDNNGNLITGNAFGIATSATASDIINGKTAYNDAGTLLTGTAYVMPTINVTLTGSSSSYISGYGAGIDQNGSLTIWAKSNSSSYENICFDSSSLTLGEAVTGFDITSFSTSNITGIPLACVVNGLSSYNTINITLDATGANATNDFVRLVVTITAS